MKNVTHQKFDLLCTQLDSGNIEQFQKDCLAVRQLGYSAVLANVFVCIHSDPGKQKDNEIIFEDDDAILSIMPAKKYKTIKEVLENTGLTMPSCHFLQTLQPFGEKPEWIFDIHCRLLDIAAYFNSKYVTTHFGWMFGEQKKAFMLDLVEKLQTNRISRDDYLSSAVERFGGREKVLNDSFIIYDHLCNQASKRGIMVTVETLPGPFNTASADGVLNLIEKIGADNLGVCVDSGHCNAVGLDVGEQIKKAGKKMFEVHFHDNFGLAENWSLSDLHNPIGHGNIDWLACIRAMHYIDYHGYITFEQSDFRSNAANWRSLLKTVENS